jgi:hypothetical protein
MSLEMAQKVIVPQKNYVPQFLKQRDINSYYDAACMGSQEQEHSWPQHTFLNKLPT